MRILDEAQVLDLLYPKERYAIEDILERMGMVKMLTLIKELHPQDFKKAVQSLKEETIAMIFARKVGNRTYHGVRWPGGGGSETSDSGWSLDFAIKQEIHTLKPGITYRIQKGDEIKPGVFRS